VVVPAYAAIYGGHVINMGDNRFPWDSRAVRENEDWVPQQRGMLAQQFVFGMAMGWMALMVTIYCHYVSACTRHGQASMCVPWLDN
jgi:hypothetical protein